MDAEGAEEVDGGIHKIVEEDMCGFAALLMKPLDQTVLYTTHRRGPLAADISAGPATGLSVQPCAPERLFPEPTCQRWSRARSANKSYRLLSGRP